MNSVMHKHIDIKDLVESCEDYLLHRYIPITSTEDQDIIDHAIKEGYQLGKYLADS